MAETRRLRWRVVDEPDDQAALFSEDDFVERHVGTGEFRGLEFMHVRANTIINEVPASSRMPFRFTINAYRGCSHACTYCFARPTHAYLGLGIGEDFDRRIVVKVNAVERLRAELRSPRWSGGSIAMGTNTDPYQRAEGKYHLTQGIVTVLRDAQNPFSLLTKSTLVLRDLGLLSDAARQTDVRVNLSVGTLDETVWKSSEPGTPPPAKRIEAVRRLNEAGVPCGVLIAPVLPGLSDADEQLEQVVRACVQAGAVSIGAVALHLRPGVREHYLLWLQSTRPDLVDAYERRYRERAYLPDAEQRALTATVRRLVDGAQGVGPARGRTPSMPAKATARRPTAPSGSRSGTTNARTDTTTATTATRTTVMPPLSEAPLRARRRLARPDDQLSLEID